MSNRRVVIVGAGQSGLAAARAARDAGWEPVVLEAGERPVGSWPAYYDSLRLFSPAEYSGFPGYGFPGRPDHYPARDEVASFLAGYATWLGVEIHPGTRVDDVSPTESGYDVRTTDGRVFRADAVIAASGSFQNPVRPSFPGHQVFGGELLPVADYRSRERFDGQRVIIVGAGNSAVQVGYELSAVARVTLAARAPVQLVPQLRAGRDAHYWLRALGLDYLPPIVLNRMIKHPPVFDTGGYAEALDSGRLEQRPVFTELTTDGVRWPDGTAEPVDAVILATGYRPSLRYLDRLGALDTAGRPLHRRGLSLIHPGLAYLGLEFQRSFSSNTLRGVHRDATFVINALGRRIRTGAGLIETQH